MRIISSNDYVVYSTTTDSSGLYSIDGVIPGEYSVIVYSVNSKEKSVSTNVIVEPSSETRTSDLELTAIGHISGRVSIDDSASGNLGILVFVAGTSYVAMTDDSGDFNIRDVPVGNNYTVVISKDGYMTVWDTVEVTMGNITELVSYNIPSTDFETVADGFSAYEIWLLLGNEGSEQDFLDCLVQDSNIVSAPYTFNNVFEFYGVINKLLLCPTPGATIIYTLDGSVPSESNGETYIDGIEITESVTQKSNSNKRRICR